MNIISYNVNGIRAAFKKDLPDWLKSAQPDVICFQETKAQPEQIDDNVFEELGYKTYWFSAQKKGYSGVGIACKKEPKHIEYGCGIEKYDTEGRIIRVDFDDVSIMSVYVPSASNIDRLTFKMEFCRDFTNYIEDLQKEIPNLVIGGDFNICHEAIDIHDPVRLKTVSGFLPMEREWMTDFMKQCNLTDSFREKNSEPDQYTWWSYRQNSRARNKGWRIDYHFITHSLQEKLNRAVILSDAMHSDHCPVLVDLEI